MQAVVIKFAQSYDLARVSLLQYRKAGGGYSTKVRILSIGLGFEFFGLKSAHY